MARAYQRTLLLSSMCLAGLLGSCSEDPDGSQAALSGGTLGVPDGTAGEAGFDAIGGTGGTEGTGLGGGAAPTGGPTFVASGGLGGALGGSGGGGQNGIGGVATGGTGLLGSGGIATPTATGSNGGIDDPGTGSVDHAGNGGVDDPGTGSVDHAGNGGVDDPGTGSVDHAGNGGVDDPGTGSVDHAGNGGCGDGGSSNEEPCSFDVDFELSAAIGTVAIVTWSTDLPSIDSAHIQFRLLDTGPTMEAPVALDEPDFRTLLLGMKGGRDYEFKIAAESGSTKCVSDVYTLTTGAVPNSVPRVARQAGGGGSPSRGFIVTSGGTMGSTPAYIFDTDGDVVWWSSAPDQTSRARMSYDGQSMWMEALNVNNAGGEMRHVSMDGLNVESVSALSSAHHDFTVLPDNSIAVITWSNGCSAIVERSSSGAIRTVVANVGTLYDIVGNDCHTNYIQYYPSDDSYTLSDRNPNLFVKLRRSGQLVWQFGGSNPHGSSFSVEGGTWEVNHGHRLMDDGRFVFFNNGPVGGTARILEYRLNESTMTASFIGAYTPGTNSMSLGDVQPLPNGNTLATVSNAGRIVEFSWSGAVIQTFSASGFGYANYRESMYGPPTQ